MYSFFKNNPQFTESNIGAEKNRLKHRNRILIKQNKKIIENSNILFIGSHDGRWMGSALYEGAKRSDGIEIRDHWINKSRENLNEAGFENYSIYEVNSPNWFENDIIKLTKNYDIICIFGLLYHIHNPVGLISFVSKHSPEYILIDSKINHHDIDFEMQIEDENKRGAGVHLEGMNNPAVLIPNEKSIIKLLEVAGYNDINKHDWINDEMIDDYTDIKDYQDGNRISIRAGR